VSVRYYLYNLEIAKYEIDTSLNLENITEYEHKKDKKDVVKFLIEERGVEQDRANSILDIWANEYSDYLFAHILARKENQIISRFMCTKLLDDTGNFFMSGDNESLDKEILAKTIPILKEKGLKNLNLFLTEDNLKHEKRHTDLGFKKEGKVSLYEKEI
jgi:hypothetical protein